MLCKCQNSWNKNSKWLLKKKAKQKMCTWKGTKNLITKTAKTVLQCRILKARKFDVNGLEAKAEVKTTAKHIQFDAWTRADTKRCNAKTGQG